jgi:pantetheine-phosphate adenylyltransferase
MTADLENVVVEHAAGLTSSYAASRGASYLVRGLRNAQDFAYETPLAYGNRSLESGLSTVFFLPEPGHAFISSALVREVITAGGVDKALVFVPEAIHALLLNGGHTEERE